MGQPVTLGQLILALLIINAISLILFAFKAGIKEWGKSWFGLRKDRELEDHKASHQKTLEDVRFKNTLRMVALDKRLEVYAKAYELLKKALENTVCPDIITGSVKILQDFFDTNAVYLDRTNLLAIHKAIRASQTVDSLKQLHANTDSYPFLELEEYQETIKEACNKILEFVALPSINSSEMTSTL